MSRTPISALLSAFVLACVASAPKPRPTHVEHFLPPNNLKVPVGAVNIMGEATGLTQDQYNQVLDLVQSIYAPIVSSHGRKLVINRLWDDATVNSQARQEGDQAIIDSYGGMARFDGVTQDGLALVTCHEMGHHLGGAPKDGIDTWASVEGEADYFANLKCLRRVFADSRSDGFTRPATVDPLAQQACSRQFSDSTQQAICARAATAGVSMAGLFKAQTDPIPAINTPDKAVVKRTDPDHPAAQCRLDTYYQGSICGQPVTAEMSDDDPSAGACTLSQGFTVGMRPLCWYKPSKGELTPIRGDATVVKIETPTEEARSAAGSLRTISALQNPSLWQGF